MFHPTALALKVVVCGPGSHKVCRRKNRKHSLHYAAVRSPNELTLRLVPAIWSAFDGMVRVVGIKLLCGHMVHVPCGRVLGERRNDKYATR